MNRGGGDPIGGFLKRRARDLGILLVIAFLALVWMNWRESGWSIQTLGFVAGGGLVVILFAGIAWFWIRIIEDSGRPPS